MKTIGKKRETRILMVAASVLVIGLFLSGCSRTPSVERVEWVSMGTIAAVQTRGSSEVERNAVVHSVKETFARVEFLLNAHDSDSELRRLSSLADADVLARCDPFVRPCYAAAFDLRRQTEGAFNPRWRGTNTLDLGAIAKGFAVDCAAVTLTNLTGDILIDLGGNLKSVRGTWRVGVVGSDQVLVLTNGMACATSGEYFRGKHIRDGRTGLAVSNAVKSVTVVHPTSAQAADGYSTTLFVLGRTEGERVRARLAPETSVYWQDVEVAHP